MANHNVPHTNWEGDDYEDEEVEFMMAVERWKVLNDRPFPTWAEILAVAKAMGYRKVEEPGPFPKPFRADNKEQ